MATYTVSILGGEGEQASRLANRLLEHGHRVIQVIKESKQTAREAGDYVEETCPLEACWEADFIVIGENVSPEPQLIEKIRQVSTQKYLLVCMPATSIREWEVSQDPEIERKLMQDWEKSLPHSPVVMTYVGNLASFVKGQDPEAVTWTIRLFQQLNLPTIETLQPYTQTNSSN
ncbi:MAG TPA: NAD(P)-binding domain-containing protein [Ferruginibacter sp.]|nr:NAD(P)-binding domain-containing protein [Ferruginibacter sp.]